MGTTTTLQPLYSSLDFVRDNPGEPVPEETFTATGNMHKKFGEVRPHGTWFLSYVSGQTDTLITMLCNPTGVK